MKKTYILAAACLMAFAGCDNKEVVNTPVDGVKMTLVTDCAEYITRADTKNGEDKFNENLIKDIHYYFFDQTTKAWVFDYAQTVGATGSAEFNLAGITASKFDEIFTGRTELDVFVVANATTPSGTSTTKVEDIKKTVLALTGFGKQDNFVMTGSGTLTKGAGTGKTAATDEITLKRVASKITLHLVVPNSFKDLAAKEWSPEFDKVQIDFNNMCKNGFLGGAIPAISTSPAPEFETVTRKASNVDEFTSETVTDTEGTMFTKLSLTVPVYSYPRVWENGDSNTPYIYITLPWVYGSVESDTYYKLLLPGTTMNPNCWYNITATLGGLGSLTKEGTTEVPLTIKISETWKDAIPDANNTEADMAMPRVLAVEQNTYILYNQDEIVIPFVSSHNCSVSSVTVTDKSHPDSMGSQQSSDVTVDNDSRTITFTHNLLNDQSSKPYDYLVYKAHFTLKHSDDANYYEEIYIEQRPALCIEPFNNANGYRNVFVDGYQKYKTGTISETSGYYYQLGGSASNTNVYTVTASVLPTTGSLSSYKIGDPRIHEPVDLTATPWSGLDNNEQGNSNSICNTTTKKLEYYYTSGTATSDIIAPAFRIGSAYAGTGNTSFSDSYVTYQLRCATYQEAGYPAGRWRLPTEAELNYCLQLQADGCLGSGIFYDDTYYICATKNVGFKVQSNSVVRTEGIAPTNCRCVYDAWYWDNTDKPRLADNEFLYSVCGDTDSNYKFVWGDAPITW